MGFSANLFSDMVFEPPFVDGFSFKSESITAAAARQAGQTFFNYPLLKIAL
jgi:hypothetical protein